MSGRASDAGETLIEILLSIMILGIAVSALMFGMGSAATTSGYHDRQAQQAETLRNLVDGLQALPYTPCATTYATPPGLVPSGYSVTTSVVGYASGATYPYPTPCPATGDEGAQQLRVTVSQPDARVRSEELYVVKRKPCTSLPC